jgi:hypothetical protein
MLIYVCLFILVFQKIISSGYLMLILDFYNNFFLVLVLIIVQMLVSSLLGFPGNFIF